jgi:hypothetical protein
MWEKYGTAKQATDDSVIWRMRCACRITKATNTYSEYEILLAVLLQQWSHEIASVLRYSCIVSLILCKL